MNDLEEDDNHNHKRRKVEAVHENSDQIRHESLDEEANLNDTEILLKDYDPITLNVGGIKYQTTKFTLLKHSNTLFSTMFSKNNFSIKPPRDGTYFIDRDGTHFRYILNFLRDGFINIGDKSIINELIQEANYYALPSMVHQLKIARITSKILDFT